MTQKPPKWTDLLSVDLFKKIIDSEEINELLNKAQKEYVYWDKFKYYPFPTNISPEEAWAYLKISKRGSTEQTPIKSVKNENFKYMMIKSLYEKLNFIDTHGAGLIKSFTNQPSGIHLSKYIMSSLTEEAIASSQIEGANTSHKVAKEMILSERKPRNKDEQMIVNNYRAMQKIEEWKDLDLTEQMLIDLQVILTDKTMSAENVGGIGRLRKDEDEIVVHDPITHEVVHVPPKEDVMKSELKNLISYANEEETESDFTHPVIKATILHFWLAYLHPFVDGNGRCSRIIFYWYLLKRDYWLIQYVSVSRSIKQSRKQYDNAFLYSENDDNDLTYFLLYIAEAFKKSILQFLDHFQKKVQEAKDLKKEASLLGMFNLRQLSLLKYFQEHSDEFIEIKTHQNKHGISRSSAHYDLQFLIEKSYIRQVRQGKKMIYLPNIQKINLLLKDSK